jgi:hypothetical protein
MGLSISIFSKKNINLIVGFITLLIFLWLIMYAIPGLFVSLFDTLLGKFILLGFILLAGTYNLNWGIGITIIFVILYQFSHMKH